MNFKLSLKERKSPHGLERHPRYDVMVGDRKVDELYFNMTGFNGALMNETGGRISIGERGISAWKREVSAINREARTVMAANDADPRRILRAERTLDGDLRKLTFDDGSDMCVLDEHYRAGVELFGEDRLRPAFFDPQENRVAIYPRSTIRVGENWDTPAFAKAIFETEDESQVAVVTGTLPEIIGKYIQGDPEVPFLPMGWTSADLAGMVGPEWSQPDDRIVFISRDTMDEIIALNERDFVRADILPGHGITSERTRIFDQMIASTGQRPDIVLTEAQEDLYVETVARSGYRVVRPQVECSETPEP